MASLKEPRPYDVFQTGTILNNTYEIKGILGRGGTGEVYLAHHQIVDREMAIKVLNSVVSANEDYLELMKREEQMRMIVHDAVVRYNECSRTNQGHVYLVMDFIDGPSLHDEMNQRAVGADDLLLIARRVLEGLVATHAQGVVHRDLSPDNIILRDARPDKATIIDFGIAKDTSAGARTIVGNDFAGKYEYAAPEQMDGQTNARSDLYALGASLLAAYRQKTPNVGTSPGEVYRNKQLPLDLDGVPAPLRDLIAELAAPDPADRPETAAAALERLSGLTSGDAGAVTVIAPPKTRDRAVTPKPKITWSPTGKSGGKGLLMALAAVAVLALIGGGVWLSGILAPGLPTASPYVFAASVDDDTSTLSGNAPSKDAAATLAAAFSGLSGRATDASALTLAGGAPSDGWPDAVRDLLQTLAPLETFSLRLADTAGTLEGFAADATTRDQLIAALDSWTSASGIQLDTGISAGPRILTEDEVQTVLDALGNCGKLHQEGAQGGIYALGDTITVRGDLATERDAETLEFLLYDLIGDRSVSVETGFLNADLCAIRKVLPPLDNTFDIRLSNGAIGETSTTGVFRTGQNPVVDIVVPASVDDAWLWVMVVDNTGKVFHVLPNAFNGEQHISQLGVVEGDTRRIRVLWSVEDVKQDGQRIAVEVTEGDYGKSEIIAILSRDQLFDLRRPRDESTVSVARALSETLKGREDVIVSVAARTIDAQP